MNDPYDLACLGLCVANLCLSVCTLALLARTRHDLKKNRLGGGLGLALSQ